MKNVHFSFILTSTQSNVSLLFEEKTGITVYPTNLYCFKICGKKINYNEQLMKLYEHILWFCSKGSMSITPHDFYVYLAAAVKSD